MKYEIYSYRYAEEILQHEKHRQAWTEIEKAVQETPIYRFPGKSRTNKSLDVVQQLLNTHFDRLFGIDLEWEYQPIATRIQGSRLTADFRKTFNDLSVQVEVQFGNMSRWYSDIFKFQAAYSKSLTQVGVCIVPMASLARRIDSNIVNFERTRRELPEAVLSITLPILLVGVSEDTAIRSVDVSETQFDGIGEITGKGKTENRFRIVNAQLNKTPMSEVGPHSETGPTFGDRADNEDEGE